MVSRLSPLPKSSHQTPILEPTVAAEKTPRRRAGNSAVVDPFGATDIRQAVLETWGRIPARFREDANSEESLVLVGYADRVVVELAANASDAAIAAGVPGVLRLSVVEGELRAANTGAPLTREGVAAMASLRASAKRDLAVGTGHFGVGFTAVLSVTDRPQIHSTAGGIEFSLDRTIAAVEAVNSADLSAELSLRHHLPPILRLPWSVPAQKIPVGFVTEVRLPLREGIDAATVLAAVGDHLLLTLSGLDVIELPDRTITRRVDAPDLITITEGETSTSWQLARRSGQLSQEFSQQRPIEERARRDWWITWAAPLGRSLNEINQNEVLYAPTPTDEALGLPARLIGTFPVDDTRRHLAAGSFADFMIKEAISGFLDLLIKCEPAQRLRLIPPGGFGLSRLDTELRLAIIEKARSTKLLLTVLGEVVAGEEAVVLPAAPDELAEMVAEAIPNLLPAPQSAAVGETLRLLGVRTLETSQMSTAMGGLGRGPRFWGRLYELLGYAGSEDLADLPVPLADGRTVLGGRGLLIPEVLDGSQDNFVETMRELMSALPTLRLVDPEAVTSAASRQLLQRLGGTTADPSTILADPSVEIQIRSFQTDLEQDEPAEHFEDFAAIILSLVAQGGLAPAGLLADVVLTSADDEPWPAGQLLLPGSPLAELIDADADIPFVADRLVDLFGTETLSRIGVLANFRIVHDDNATGADHDLPDEDLWWDEVVDSSAESLSFSAIADLDLIDPHRWPAALAAIAGNREALACLHSPAGMPISYSRWWLANFAVLENQPPKYWKLATATDLGGLFDVLPVGISNEMAEMVGVQTSLARALMADPEELLDRLTDPRRELVTGLVAPVTAALVAVLAERVDRGVAPDRVRTLSGAVVAANDALVLDEPWLAQVLAADELVPGGRDPGNTAAFFDLDLASTALGSSSLRPSPGEPSNPDAAIQAWLAMGGDPADVTWLDGVQFTPMLAVEVEGVTHRVTWWVTGQSYWVDGSAPGWGRLLAYRHRSWSLRHLVTALLTGAESEAVEFGVD